MSSIDQETIGVRGRFGTDIWGRWLSAGDDVRHKFLADYGVRANRIGPVATQLEKILAAEGITKG